MKFLGFLVNFPELGSVLAGLGEVKLDAMADVSYGSHDDRKSHSGCTHISEPALVLSCHGVRSRQ